MEGLFVPLSLSVLEEMAPLLFVAGGFYLGLCLVNYDSRKKRDAENEKYLKERDEHIKKAQESGKYASRIVRRPSGGITIID